MSTEVIQLEPSQIYQASEILGNAFSEDPIFHYIAPEKHLAKNDFIRCFCQTTLRYTQLYKHTYTTSGNIQGVATWMPPGHSSDNILQMLQSGILTLPFKLDWKKLGRVMSFVWASEQLHKRHMPKPHWYLALLAVAPNSQRKGIGGILLEPILKQADSQGLPCYLETSTEKAVRFYQKHGFDIIWSGELLKNSPYWWAMKREPN